VPELARSLLDDPDRLELMAERMRALAKPDAARVIAEELIELGSS
jgi:UDP-N-acetylglucosamine:LPS N-acetylglucosamine transferase